MYAANASSYSLKHTVIVQATSKHDARLRLPHKTGNSDSVSAAGDFLDMNNASWLRTLDINLTAVLVGIRLAAAAMIQQKSKGATETP